ncbi:potassium channel family protein [Colwellia sp. 75C3]|uniref:potassium channel family protein n=1 Tax=Colwellia sp. 75C3 TaxID=888425 RepID=UPI0018E2AB63|nr:potassium channel family protein [Colwellia sp. 75C3]
MIILQSAMEKSNLFKVDEFGVKNYNYGILAVVSFALFAFINIGLGYITFVAETAVVGSPVKNYADAFWLMLMSSTTIGFGDVYPITLAGRIAVFVMFILGVGILGGVGAIFANKIFGFADTNIKNRELRKQNEEILQQNNKIYQKLTVLEEKLESFEKKAK